MKTKQGPQVLRKSVPQVTWYQMRGHLANVSTVYFQWPSSSCFTPQCFPLPVSPLPGSSKPPTFGFSLGAPLMHELRQTESDATGL